MTRTVTVSIVSHGHCTMLPGLLRDLGGCPEVAAVILTRNVPGFYQNFGLSNWLTVVDNPRPKGFGENHNAAFRQSRTPFFAVLNPDIRFRDNPFPSLISCMDDSRVGLSAPAVVDPSGVLEDSARRFPTPFDLALKALGRYDGKLAYSLGDPPRAAPWVAGMFMVFRSTDFSAVGGFDEDFFLYYEDVDLCARLWRAGRRVMLCPGVHAIHDARRASRHDLRHMGWHAASMLRYFRKHTRRPGTPDVGSGAGRQPGR